GVGVQHGILLAMVLSLLRHVRHNYRPHTAVLIQDDAGAWLAVPPVPGTITRPGLLVFRFGAELFYANVGRFVDDVRRLLAGAPQPVRWLVVDAGAITSVDYSAARVLQILLDDLAQDRVTLLLVHAEKSLLDDLERHRVMEAIGREHVFDTLHEALAAIRNGAASRSK